MTRAEIDTAVDWAAAEGWNPGLHDADCFHAADPEGFFVGMLGAEAIASISAVKYGDSFGFIGFYIVKPEYRGRGYGSRIWNRAIATLHGRNIGLDGVVDQQENYRKSGFALAYRNIRYQGVGGGTRQHDNDIVPLSTLAFDEIVRYDRAFFPDNRLRFLERWIAQRGVLAVGVLDQRRLAGYGVMRSCRTGYKIGPLFADSPELAERLFGYFRAKVPASVPIFLDVPEINQPALDLVEHHSMSAAFETARMYTGEFPRLPVDRLFGVTTFELG
ncbi:MAG TPA: GNAT family N-acetyltransferase [Rudaea sp.]|nr:GNAT family N-acetyltransferase [Rudaea sp.]